MKKVLSSSLYYTGYPKNLPKFKIGDHVLINDCIGEVVFIITPNNNYLIGANSQGTQWSYIIKVSMDNGFIYNFILLESQVGELPEYFVSHETSLEFTPKELTEATALIRKIILASYSIGINYSIYSFDTPISEDEIIKKAFNIAIGN